MTRATAKAKVNSKAATPASPALNSNSARAPANKRGGRKAAADQQIHQQQQEDDAQMKDETAEEEKEGEHKADASSDAEEDEDDFDLSALVAQASSSLASRLSRPVPIVSSRPIRPSHSRVIHSSSDLDHLFSTVRATAPIAAAAASSSSATPATTEKVSSAIPAGFVRRGGVLHLTASMESAAAAQTSEAPAAASKEVDLLAAIGGGKTTIELAQNPTQQKKLDSKNVQKTAGANWFNFSRPSVITKEMKTDLKLLSLRAYMDPKKFYKKESKKKKVVPTFFQMGTVIEGAHEFYSGRLSKSERSEHYADPLVDSRKNHGEIKKMKNYLKKKTIQVQEENKPQPRTFNKKRKAMDDAQKKGHSKKKKF